jgi:serine/threonine protein kinase
VTSDARVGTALGNYQILEVIGSGGMGVVYLAEHRRLRRRVALKVLTFDLSQDPAFRERFERESQIAASLDHANIVPFYEADEAQGVYYIAMKYVEGSDLRRIIQQEGGLDLDRALIILAQAAQALDAAHEKGLVHRDVKPANILIEAAAGKGIERAYLSDFGLTKLVALEASGTATGQFVGTIHYIAPEQIKGESVDARTDIYSLGCVLYECLVGVAPFEEQARVAPLYEIYAHLEEPPTPVTDSRPDLPRAVNAVIATAMAKSKSDRYRSCGSMMEAAHSALKPQVTLPKRSRRRVVWVAVAALVAATAITIPFLLTRSHPRASPGFRGGNVWVANLDGTSLKQVTFASTNIDGSASWSPDGSKMAFSEGPENGDQHLYSVNVTTGEIMQLTFGPSRDKHPTWSPGGDRIAFVRQSTAEGSQREIWIVNADGSDVMSLKNPTLEGVTPAWSPGGDHIAFSDAHHIFVTSADGNGSVEQLTSSDRNDISPAWSPDGSQIAFAGESGLNNNDIWIRSLDNIRPAQNITENTPQSDEVEPTWSPDGTQIAFVSNRAPAPSSSCRPPSCPWEIYVMATDGTNQRTFMVNANNNFNPVWAPGDDRIAFISDRPGRVVAPTPQATLT